MCKDYKMKLEENHYNSFRKRMGYGSVRLADDLVNLTDTTISVYDDVTGDVVSFKPASQSQMGLIMSELEAGFHVYYVVDDFRTAKALLDIFAFRKANIAVVTEKSGGRNNSIISKLVSAREPERVVRFMSGLNGTLAYA